MLGFVPLPSSLKAKLSYANQQPFHFYCTDVKVELIFSSRRSEEEEVVFPSADVFNWSLKNIAIMLFPDMQLCC